MKKKFIYFLPLFCIAFVSAIDIKPQHPKALITKHTLTKGEKDEKNKQKKIYNERASKTIKGMTEDELREYINACIALEYFEEAIKGIEQLITITKNMILAKEARIEVADIYFEKGNWKVAADKYNEFIKLYPADKHIDYAQYKALISLFYCLPTHDRDQKNTQEVILLSDELLKKNHPFSQDIKQIRSHCYRKLYEHNTDIFNQYMKKGSYAAAEKRLEQIRKTFTPSMIENFDFLSLELEYKLASAQHDATKKGILEQKLAMYPNYSKKFKVASTANKKSYVSFF